MAGKNLPVKSEEHLAPFNITEFDKLFDRMREMQEAISRRAFELFEKGGRVFGRDLDNWLEAERIVMERYKEQEMFEKESSSSTKKNLKKTNKSKRG